MAYLIDTNVLIRAKREWYRFGTFPGFWALMKQLATDGVITSVEAVHRELVAQKDELSDWVAQECPTGLFVAPDAGTAAAAGRVTAWTVGPLTHYSEAAHAEFFAAADYWIVAQALAHGHTVVTHEIPAPQSVKNIKVPDACNALGVPWLNSYQMLEEVGARF